MQWQFNSHADFLGHPGLLDATDTPRPAATAFRVTSEKLTGATHAQRLGLGADVHAYRLVRPGGEVFVLWSTRPATVALPVRAGVVRVTDVRGQVSTAAAGSLAVGESPVFVELP